MLLTKKQLTQKINGIGKRMGTIRDDIHVVLCHAAGHAYEHGDVSNFTRLFASTSGVNRKLMVKWIHECGFGRLQPNETFKLNKSARKDADFADGAAVAEYLMAETPWYVKEENANEIIRALDVAKRIESLAKSIEKASNDDKPLEISAPGIELAVRQLHKAITNAQAKRRVQQTRTEPETAPALAIAAE